MAERALKLEWEPMGGPFTNSVKAESGPAKLYVLEAGKRGWAWHVGKSLAVDHVDGTAPTLLAAQLAAEDAALAWLREGVEALGGKVLDADEAALCVDALWQVGSQRRESDSGFVCADASMLELARELGGG